MPGRLHVPPRELHLKMASPDLETAFVSNTGSATRIRARAGLKGDTAFQ